MLNAYASFITKLYLGILFIAFIIAGSISMLLVSGNHEVYAHSFLLTNHLMVIIPLGILLLNILFTEYIRQKLINIPKIKSEKDTLLIVKKKKPKLLIKYHLVEINKYIKANIIIQFLIAFIIYIIEFLLIHAKLNFTLGIVLTILFMITVLFYMYISYSTYTIYKENVPNKSCNNSQNNYANVFILNDVLYHYTALNRITFLDSIKNDRDKAYNFNLIPIRLLNEFLNEHQNDIEIKKILDIKEKFFEKIHAMGYLYPNEYLKYNKIDATKFIEQSNNFYDMLGILWQLSDNKKQNTLDSIKNETLKEKNKDSLKSNQNKSDSKDGFNLKNIWELSGNIVKNQSTVSSKDITMLYHVMTKIIK